ncbi:MAG: hypothetical protein ABL921_17285, partial [Pirellula sp.]
MDNRPSRTIECVFCFAIAVVYAILHTGTTQAQTSPGEMLADFQKAKEAYASKEFKQSAELFRSVSSRCAGSELSLQCDYLAAISEWAHNPSEESIEKLGLWLQNFDRFKTEATAAGRIFNRRLLQSWARNSQFLQAKWDRQRKQIESAESRLRSLLDPALEVDGATTRLPDIWLELGSLLLEDR